MQVLNGIDATGKRAQEVLDGVAQAVNGIGGKGAMNIEKLNAALSKLAAESTLLRESEDISQALKVEKAITSLGRVVDVLRVIKNESYTISGVSPSFSSAEQRVEEILQQRRHAKEQNAKAEAELERQRQEKMKLSAQIAQETYTQEIKAANEKSKAFSAALRSQMEAQAELERQRQEKLRQSAQIAQETYSQEIRAANEKAKAFSSALQRQMEAEEKLRQSQVRASDDTIRRRLQKYLTTSEQAKPYTPFVGSASQFRGLQEAYAKAFDAIGKDYEKLQEKMSRYRGPTTSDWYIKTEAQIRDIEDRMQRLVAASENVAASMSKQMYSTYKPYNTSAAEEEQARIQRTQTLKQAILERMEVEKREAAETAAAEKRKTEAIQRTNQARQEAVASARKQAEALVRLRTQELESQRQQLQGLYSKGRGFLSTEELSQLKSAFSQVTQELNILRTAMSNLGSYSVKDLFSMGRGTSDFSPLISAKQQAVQLEKEHQREVAATAAKVRSDLAGAFDQVRNAASGISTALQDLKGLFLQGGVVYGVKQFADAVIKTGGEIVQQHIALRSILGDVTKADELFKQTQELALQSPFKFGELNRDVKQLAAFGVEANDLYDTTKRLADIASGLGVSFERLGLAYGQVKARSWLDGKELRQFAYAGLPLLKSIATLYNSTAKNGKTDYSEADIKKMISAREVSFDDVKQVLWEMTDKGGKFYNMQFVLSDTLLGRWNKLIDAWDIMLGKFADGENVIGKVFTGIIDQVTNLVLMVDKLSPALLALGGMMVLKKGVTSIASKTGLASELALLQQAQQTELRRYMIEQNRLVLEGQITREKATQNVMAHSYMLADTQSKASAMEKLALEGKLSLLQMQKAVREGLVSRELIKQLEITGMISAKQSELITKSGVMSRLMLAGNQGMSKLGGFFSGWNLATIGVTVGMALYSGYKSFKDKITSDADELREKAKTNLKNMEEVLADASPKANYGGELQSQVDKMKEVLEQSGLYTDTIKEQVEHIDDLSKEYDYLKQKIVEAKEANTFNQGETEMYARAKAATGAGFTGGADWWGYLTGIGQDNIEENVDDTAQAFARLQLKMEKFDASTKDTMDRYANSILGAKAQTMSFEEKIAKICSQRGANGFWANFVMRVANGNEDIAKSLRGLEDDLDTFGDNYRQITTDDIPKYLKQMAKEQNMSMDEFSEWCKKHPTEFRKMLDQMLADAKKKIPSLVTYLERLTRALLGLKDAKSDNNKPSNKPTGWKNPLKVGTVERTTYDELYKNGKLNGKAGNFHQKEMADFIKAINGGKSSGWNDFADAVRKKYKEVRDENDSAKNAHQKQPYTRQQKMLEAIAAQNGIDLNVGKNKATGNFGKDGNKADKELKALQERLDGYKKARQEYQKYKTIMSDDDAKQRTYKDFPELKGFDLDDYQKTVKSLMGKINLSTTAERRKFKNSLYKEISDWLFAEKDKVEFEKKANDYKELLDRTVQQWDVYKDLLEETGDKNYARASFFDGYLVDDKTKDLIKQYKAQFGVDFGLQDAMSMSDGEAKNKLRGAGQYEAWKKITDLLRNNYVQALKDGANLIKESLSYEEQIGVIREKYSKMIDTQKQQGNTRAATVAQTQMTKEISSVNMKKITDSADYAKFFSKTINQGKKDLSQYADLLRKELSKALKDGGISAEEYAKKIDAINKRMNGLDDYKFMGGGLNGIADSLKNKGQRQVEDGQSVYTNAQKAYNTATAAGDVQGMTGADKAISAGKSMMDGGAELMAGADSMSGSIAIIDKIIHGINDLVQGLNDTFQDIKETAEALGHDTTTSDWEDANTFFSSFSSASQSATDGWDSLKEGNIGGVISGVVGSWTGWIKGYAQGHDKKLENLIQNQQRMLDLMQNIADNVSTVINNTLGGIYNYQTSDYVKTSLEKAALEESKYKVNLVLTDDGVKVQDKSVAYEHISKAQSTGEAYDEQLASLYMQETSLKTQRAEEAAKKDSDATKRADYDKQIEDLRLQIENFTTDWLKNIYNVDLKSWASQLTDAIVDAWSKGEDAADAYHDTVQELMKDLSKSIISQSIMEMRMQPVLDKYKEMLEKNSGKLNKEDLPAIWSELMSQMQEGIDDTYDFLDYAKNNGVDLSENGSLSTSNSIKSITEETADLLASYINAIRLDVSVNRENITAIAEAVKTMPTLNVIAQSQLDQLNTLVILARDRNSIMTEMYTWMRAVTNGTKQLHVA